MAHPLLGGCPDVIYLEADRRETRNLTTVLHPIRTQQMHSAVCQALCSSPIHHNMKLHADKLDSQSITAYGDGWISVNGQRHTQSLVLAPSGQLAPWSCDRFEDLTVAHFSMLTTITTEPPELVIFGSGSRLRFLRPALFAPLMDQRIGLETMDTAAACRTYNILMGEGRRVVAALLMET